LDRKCDLGTAKLQRKKAQKQLFNLLYPHRKNLGKELENLGKTLDFFGVPSANSWGNQTGREPVICSENLSAQRKILVLFGIIR
jgi:hypothetical protein